MCREKNVSHLVEAVIWLWIHLLQFNLANQTRDEEEDKRNKPWRPLPLGRITLRQALTLHWITALVCMLFSRFYSARLFAASATFTTLVSLYHGMAFHSHWLMKNIMNAAGLTCLGWGASLLAGMLKSLLSLRANNPPYHRM